MRVTLDLSAETEQRLREKAARLGQTVEEFLRQVAERVAASEDATPPAPQAAPAPMTAAEWSAAWRAWAASHRPAGPLVDDSRESIYAGRGE